MIYKWILTTFIYALVFLRPAEVMGQSDTEFFFGFDLRKYENIKVEKVLQSDLLQMDDGEKVKLIGIKRVAEVKRKKNIDRDEHGFAVAENHSPVMPLEERAYEFVAELLEGKSVRLEFDDQKKDDDYNTLAYVFLLEDGLFVNAAILKAGMALLQVRPPNKKYRQELRSAYQEARREFIGIHN